MNRTVLYVSGFSPDLRAKDLAWEFERYGRLIRCDIPAPKGPTSSAFAFIEFRYERDAEDAFYDMHGRAIDGRRIAVQWAKRPPSSQWRHDGSSAPEKRDSRGTGNRDEPPPRQRSPSPPRQREIGRSRETGSHDHEHQEDVPTRRQNGSHRSASPDVRKMKGEDGDVQSVDRGDGHLGQ